MNQLMIIAPYWDDSSGTWVFDRPDLGLYQEPFVLGVPHMIDQLTKDITNARNGFRLIFSHEPFPQFNDKLTRLQRDMGGWWYRDNKANKGWLCPAIFCFFKTAPMHIYIKAESI